MEILAISQAFILRHLPKGPIRAITGWPGFILDTGVTFPSHIITPQQFLHICHRAPTSTDPLYIDFSCIRRPTVFLLRSKDITITGSDLWRRHTSKRRMG